MSATTSPPPANSTRRVLFASLVGTTIEFFDFYIFATAAVLVFPRLFFPAGDEASAMLQSLATYAVAFFARPVGSALFGHYGDRIGRKATLVAALLTMGLSTVVIGLLPTYASIGLAAPLLLALCRMGQGIGLGGEWGGAVLLATENAPPGRQGWYGMFPQLGAPLGFLLATGSFLLLTALLDDADFLAWGWRIPFVASAVLVFVGLYVRLRLTETPAFQRAVERSEVVRVPMLEVCVRHTGPLLLGTLAAIAVFVLFSLMTVFTLAHGTRVLGFERGHFLLLQMTGVLAFGITIPLSALLADRFGLRPTIGWSMLAVALYGLAFPALFGAGTDAGALVTLSLGLALMGLIYAPLGTALGALFPTAVRYTGTSLAFNLAGILGGSATPYIATSLAARHGLGAVGLFLSAAASVALLATLLLRLHPPSAPAAAARPR
jgi:metabolite-proton symporter